MSTLFKDNLKYSLKHLSKLDKIKLDKDKNELLKAYKIVFSNNLLNLSVKPKMQGEEKFLLYKNITPISGALSFLLIQNLAANTIMQKNNYAKKDKYLKKSCGIAINHLRSNKTHVWAKKVDNGYLLNGKLTWASGYKIFKNLLIGFHFNNSEYEAICKFKKSKNFIISKPINTFVGNSLNTVNIILKDFYIEDKNIISINKLGNYNENKAVSKTIHFNLYAIALKSLDFCLDNETKQKSKKILRHLKKEFLNVENQNKLDELRVELFLEAQKIITISMIKNGGISVLKDKKLQQFYRELIMFNSNGLNSNMKELFKQSYLNA